MSDGAERPRSVLVVDEDRRVARALERLLVANDRTISVVAVTHVARIAPHHLHRLDLAVVVLGTEDHDLNGLRQLTSLTSTPIIAVSSRDGMRAAALRGGAALFLHFGNAPEDVLATLRQALLGPEELDTMQPGA